jgi:hypothetical protein
MKKIIYFDMDGTIADLYNVENWLPKLQNEDASPYLEAQPMVNLEKVTELLNSLGWEVGIISWLSKNSTKAYKQSVRKAKKEWLARHFNVKLSETHFVQYGTRKDYVAKLKDGILFDDDAEVRADWRGIAIDPQENCIIETLENLIAAG